MPHHIRMDRNSSGSIRMLAAFDKGYRAIDGSIVTPLGAKRKLSRCEEYPSFTMKIPGTRKTVPIRAHTLAAYQKYGDRIFDKGIQIRHKNGNALDFTECNILLGTPTENIMDRPANERQQHGAMASASLRKYSDDIINEVKSTATSTGFGYKRLSKIFPISRWTIRYMLKSNYPSSPFYNQFTR